MTCRRFARELGTSTVSGEREWSSQHVHTAQKQVNDLKHTPRGVHDQRRVTYKDAIAGVSELLDLIEAWTARP